MKIGVLDKTISFIRIIATYGKTPFPFAKSGLQISSFIPDIICLQG